MPLPSLFKRKDPAPGRRKSAAEDRSAVDTARVQARRRLIGAVVLLGAGIVVFPLIFETQPRPIALDTPIELPKKDRDSAAPRSTPPPRVATKAAPLPSTQAPPEPAVEPPPAPANKTPAPVALPAPSRAALEAAPAVAKADDGKRAQALLEAAAPAQPAASNDGTRFIVQVGAYSDAGALRDVRAKVDKLGLKSYTQVVETDAGRRTRVRVGPFATREEADSAGAKLKSAGLPAAIFAP